MTPEEIRNVLTEIGTDEDEASRRDKLATVSEEVRILAENCENLQNNNNILTADNEHLRSANMKLFLQLGNDKNTNTGNEEEEKNKENEKRKFEDLFNDKGDVK